MTKNSWKTFNKTLAEVFEAQDLSSEQSENILKALENTKIRNTISKAFKPRAAKDPNRPTRPMTSYIRWSKEMREPVKAALIKKNGKLEGLELQKAITKELGARWGKMTAKDKVKYENAYKEEKAEYDEKMKTYEPPTSGSEEAAPKTHRGLSGWTLFGKEHRAEVVEENPEIKNTEVMKELSAKWKDLSDAEKEKYNSRAKEMNEETKANGTTTSSSATKSSKRAKPAEKKAATTKTTKTASKTAKSSKAEKAEKPAAKTEKAEKPAKATKAPAFKATPGFNRFAQEKRTTDETNISGKELQTKWLAMDDEERQQYEEDAEALEEEN